LFWLGFVSFESRQEQNELFQHEFYDHYWNGDANRDENLQKVLENIAPAEGVNGRGWARLDYTDLVSYAPALDDCGVGLG